MVHSARADPSLNTVLCGGLEPHTCARFGGTHGAVDVTKPGQFLGLVQGPKSSTVGFGALGSLARPGPSFGLQIRGALPLLHFGWLRPRDLRLPLFRGAAASQTYRPMPRAFAYQTPSPLSWRAASQPARSVLGAPPPCRPWGGGGGGRLLLRRSTSRKGSSNIVF